MYFATPDTITAAVLILVGAWGLLFQSPLEAWLHRRRQRQLAQRLGRGREGGVEVQADAPPRSHALAHRIGGGLMILLGAAYLYFTSRI